MIETIGYITLVILPYVVVPLYLVLVLQRVWFWMKLYNPALKLIPGPKSTFKVWSRQYRPTIRLFPKPQGSRGIRLWRDFKGFVLFAGLFRSDRVLWVGSWLFHASLAILFLIHLKWVLPLSSWIGDAAIRDVGRASGWVLLVSALLLLIRRLLVTRVRQITSFTDYFSEILISLTVASGLWVVYDRPDGEEVSRYLKSLVVLSPLMPAFRPNLILHLLSVQVLLAVMPFSHLLHSGGIFVSRRFLASADSFSGDVD